MVAVRASQERTVGHYKATWCHGFHIFSAISLRFVKMFKVQERTASPLLTRDQIALRDLVSLCITLLYLRTRSGSAIMNVGRCDCNLFLLWRTDNYQKKKVD